MELEYVVTRNIDVAGGVVNGTNGTVENIQPNLIKVRRHKDSELGCITCVKHYVSLPNSIDVAIREQFPLILGLTITVQRSGHDHKQQCICCIGFNILCHGTGLCGTM